MPSPRSPRSPRSPTTSGLSFKIKSAIVNHFSSTKYVRSDAQLEREKWLIPGAIPFTRWLLMPAAVLIQLCVGSLYAFSGMIKLQCHPIEAAIYGPGTDRAMASVTFYIAVAVFGSTAAILGPWMERNGPLRGTLLGAALFYIGNLLAALGVYVKQFWVIWLGYGVVGGMGLGIGYISPVSPLQKWFPEIRGVAAGLAVCGFGGGSIIAPFTQKALIGAGYEKNLDLINLGVPLTFVILGSCYFVIMVLCGLVLRMPPPGYEVKGINIETIKGAENTAANSNIVVLSATRATADTLHERAATSPREEGKTEPEPLSVKVSEPNAGSVFSMSLLESLGSYEYGLMYGMLFCAQITGLLIISRIQPIITDQFKLDSNMAATYNSILGVMNLAGRLALPSLSDFVGRKPLFLISIVAQAICVGLMPMIIHMKHLPSFLAVAFIIAMFYGAGFGIIPAFLADQFGSKNVGATHGMILTAWSLAGVVGGLVFNAIVKSETARVTTSADIYDINLVWVLVIVCVGFFITALIPVNLRERRLPCHQGEFFRFVVRGRLARVFWPSTAVEHTSKLLGFKIKRYTEAEENAEWEDYVAQTMMKRE
ncbi:major facilitator superfamily domain-containing protein [Cladochytrium replicatum]|nr:major facilitator superfamily domain-containing protein [Cladochytrium replicatum]